MTPYWQALVWIENWLDRVEAVEEWELESHVEWAARLLAQYEVARLARRMSGMWAVPEEVPRKEQVREREPWGPLVPVAAVVPAKQRVLWSEEAKAQDAIELCRAERAKRPVVPLKRLKRAEWRKAFWVPREAWSYADGWWYDFRDARMDRAEVVDDESGWWRERDERDERDESDESDVHAGECVFVCDGEEQDVPVSVWRSESRNAS